MVALDTLAAPTEGIRFRQPQTRAWVVGEEAGLGTLFVAEACLAWVGDGGRGFSLQYPSISLHAISRDTAAFPLPCIYAMLDVKPSDLGAGPGAVGDAGGGGDGAAMEAAEDGDSEASSDAGVSEVRFAPLDESVLEELYKAICDCQTLHPDPDQAEDDDDGEAYGDPDDDYADETFDPTAEATDEAPTNETPNNHHSDHSDPMET